MATDQEIRDRGFLYIPKQKYLQNPYNLPIAPVPPAAPASGGITNTNAFTNSSGGPNFSLRGNAFGYGSPVSEVNVRTFNPQKLPGAEMPSELGFSNNTVPLGNNRISSSQLGINLPGGQVQNTYTRARNAMDIRGDDAMSRDYPQFTAKEVARLSNNSIQDYRQNYQANYNSPYDDTVDLGYMGRDTSTSLEGRIGKDGIRRRSGLGKAIDFVTGFIPGVGAVKKGAKFIGGLLPDNPSGPGGGTYGIAGLSDEMKGAYNDLAKGNMLFNGQNGMKTLTGKNFAGKGYLQGQLDLYDKKGYGEYTVKEDDVYDAKGKKLTGFLKKQYQEASTMYKTTQKQKKEAEEQKKQEEAQAAQAAVREKNLASQGKSDPNDQSRTGSFGRRPGSGGNVERRDSGPDRNTDDTGQTYDSGGREGYGYGLKEGGRAGYFFGGRVSFKNGGLASIL